jgi:S-adenosylmethionine:tRNA ribosyltransferase-isomerase
MRTSDFHYELPKELIAQTPLERRDDSRLMRLDKRTGVLEHRRFFELPELLREGDCLVLNDSRVLPARLFGVRATGGAVEVVLLRDRGDGVWECLTRPGRKTKVGTRLYFSGDTLEADENASLSAVGNNASLSAVVIDEVQGGNRLIRFFYDGIFLETLERLGKMPLPPYIHEELKDSERYQTVFSRVSGSAAAPTAGLHFTKALLGSLEARGITVSYVTLHVGLGTFRPVKAENIEDHEMHAEYCEIPAETASAVSAAKREGRRVVAVGTTSCRTLESLAASDGAVAPFSDFTNAFIYPGYRFKCVDALITNFHLPESTLLMLVSALAGRENILRAYEEAVRERYRFFSFGDAMLIE